MNNMKIHTLKIGRRYEAYRRKIHCVVRYDDEEEGKINFFFEKKKKKHWEIYLILQVLACLLARSLANTFYIQFLHTHPFSSLLTTPLNIYNICCMKEHKTAILISYIILRDHK